MKNKNARKLELRALPALLEKRNTLLDEMDALIGKAQEETRALDETEMNRFEEIKKEIAGIDKTLQADEERRSMERMRESKPDSQMEKRTLDEAAFLKFVRGEERALNVANNGAVIPETIANRIIEQVKELSPIYQKATVYNIGGDLVFPCYDDSSDGGAALVEDMAELTESTGKFTTIKLENYIVGVLKVISKSLMNRTGFDLVSFIVQKVAENIAEYLEEGLLNGQTGKYEGVFATANLVTSAAANAVTADELIDVQMTVPQQFQNNACWLMHKSTFKAIRKLKDNDGNYLLNKDITGGFGWSLLGKPVYISENAPQMAAGKTALVYGDLSGLYVKLAQNVEIQLLPETFATQHAVGVVGYVEFDSKIVEKQKLAGLKMKSA